jgi:NADH-quinone oxidoreductase subunit E
MPLSPAEFRLTDEDKAKLRARAKDFALRRSAILPGLHIAYDRFGHINMDLCRQIAEVLNVPAIWVVEASSFYTFFPKKPVGRFHLKVCDSLSCSLRGAVDMIRYLEEKHGIRKGQVTSDGLFSLVSEECLAACGSAPMLQINDTYHENLTPEKLDRLIEACRKQAAAEAGETDHARA